MASKIEKELTKISKVSKKSSEDEQTYFARIVTACEKIFDKDGDDETTWKSLSEDTQKWFNAAADAKAAETQIPNFDGEIVEDESPEAAAAEAEAEEQNEEEEAMASEKEDKKKKAAPSSKKSAKAPKKAAAKAAAAPEKKSGKKAAGNGEVKKRGRTGSFSETDKITKVAAKNPFREGSKAADCFKQYKVGRTVKAVLEAGVPRSKLNRHMSKGVLSIG